MEAEIEKAHCGVIVSSILKKRREGRKKKRTIWSKKWLLQRKEHTHINLLEELRLYPSDFHSFLRIDEETYLELLSLVSPLVERQDTVMRKAISPHERLIATLRFLATSMNYEDLKFSSCISPQALGYIIPETCRVIYSVLAKDYLKLPQSAAQWSTLAHGFAKRWQFPNCLGAIDGKNIAISQPRETGSYFYNYKGFFSMVLMGIANPNYELIYVHFGTNGIISDGGVIENTQFFDKLRSKELDIPQKSLENNLPFVIVADEAFGLRNDLLKPYNVKILDDKKRIFNYRLSRARMIIENVFGILVDRFGVLTSKPSLTLEHTEDVVMACCVLHNFLRSKIPNNYTPEDVLDSEDHEYNLQQGLRIGNDNIAAIGNCPRRNANNQAKETRDAFMEYCISMEPELFRGKTDSFRNDFR